MDLPHNVYLQSQDTMVLGVSRRLLTRRSKFQVQPPSVHTLLSNHIFRKKPKGMTVRYSREKKKKGCVEEGARNARREMLDETFAEMEGSKNST